MLSVVVRATSGDAIAVGEVGAGLRRDMRMARAMSDGRARVVVESRARSGVVGGAAVRLNGLVGGVFGSLPSESMSSRAEVSVYVCAARG